MKSSANYRLTFLGYLINFRRNSRRRVIEIFSMLAEKGWTLYLLSLLFERLFSASKHQSNPFIDGKMSYCCHSDDGPPVGVKHCLERRFLVFLLENKDQGGEHDGPHEEEEEEQAELFVVCLHGVAQGLQAGGVPGQLEDPDDPQSLHDPRHLQKSEVLGCSTNIS